MGFRKTLQVVLAVVIVVSTSGCASMFHGTSQQVSIRSNDNDAKLYVNEAYIGKGNGVATFKKKKKYTIVARKEGCADATAIPTKSFDALTLLGVFIDWGIFTVLIIDGAATGAWKQFDQTSYVLDPNCPNKLKQEVMLVDGVAMGRTEDRLVNSGIEISDILTVARKMAISILETPEIMNAEERPKIALIPVANLGNFNINENVLTKRIRVELNKNAREKMSFIARDFLKKNQVSEYIMKERLIKREEKSNDEVGVTNITSSKDLDLVGVDFFLTGELNGLVKESISGQSDYVMMSFQLIDAETGVIVWEDAYEIKRGETN